MRVLSAAAVAVSIGCGGSSDGVAAVTNPGGGGGGGGGGGSGPVATNAVTVSDNTFSPNAITVAPGTNVTWTWSGASSIHNVTFGDGTGSGDKGAGSTFSKTFTTAGTFTYQCTIHAGMTGSVVVQ